MKPLYTREECQECKNWQNDCIGALPCQNCSGGYVYTEVPAPAPSPRAADLETVIRAIESEPECPDDMPQEMIDFLRKGSRKDIEHAFRVTVQETKKGIIARLRAHPPKDTPAPGTASEAAPDPEQRLPADFEKALRDNLFQLYTGEPAPGTAGEADRQICLRCGELDAKIESLPPCGPDGESDEGCSKCGGTEFAETTEKAIEILVKSNNRIEELYFDAAGKLQDLEIAAKEAAPGTADHPLEVVGQEDGSDGMPVRVLVSNGVCNEWFFSKGHPMAQAAPGTPIEAAWLAGWEAYAEAFDHTPDEPAIADHARTWRLKRFLEGRTAQARPAIEKAAREYVEAYRAWQPLNLDLGKRMDAAFASLAAAVDGSGLPQEPRTCGVHYPHPDPVCKYCKQAAQEPAPMDGGPIAPPPTTSGPAQEPAAGEGGAQP